MIAVLWWVLLVSWWLCRCGGRSGGEEGVVSWLPMGSVTRIAFAQMDGVVIHYC